MIPRPRLAGGGLAGSPLGGYDARMSGSAASAPVVLFFHRGGWQDRYQATTLAVTAAALGDEVTVALFFEPLRLWVQGRFDEGAPPEAGAARVAGLRESLEEARRELGLRVVACDTAVRLAGFIPEDLRQHVDGIATLPSLWRAAQAGRALVF
jgi:peroxiredoxin family protein